MFVIGTAGHVDHGKSTLVATLTGAAMDRLAQEKARGMTIDLNFAHVALPSLGEVGVVDVPGHQRYVKNMVSGVAALDAFLFVVAADDGWMPQSEEHLRILAALGVRHGIVVLTKIDLVDEEHAAEVRSEVEARFSALSLPPPAVLSFSAKAPGDSAPIKEALAVVLKGLPPRNQGQRARLWIDRAFSPVGEGVVATGTLLEGRLTVGQPLNAWPSGKIVVVRGLQTYAQKVDEVVASSRVALSLGGGTVKELGRGTLLTELPAERTAFFEARITFWKKVPKRNFTAFLHSGTGKVAATILDVGEGFRIKLSTPWPLRAGDRFLIRSAGEEQSLGGGLVTDPLPRHGTKVQANASIAAYREGAAEWLAFLEAKGPVVAVAELRNSRFYCASTEQKLCDTSQFLRLSPHHILRIDQYKKVTEPWHSKILAQVTKSNEALSRAQLEKCLEKEIEAHWGVNPKRAKPFLAALLEKGEGGVWDSAEGGYLPRGAVLHVAPAVEKALSEARARLEDSGPVPVLLKDWIGADKNRKEAIKKAIARKEIVGLGEGFYLAAPAYTSLQKKIAHFLRDNPGAGTPAVRDALGLSRRDTVLLLEKLDAEGITRFAANGRTLTALAEGLL